MDQAVANRLIGVIDLIGGRAVHAIAGNRQHYREVSFCAGDPLALARHYAAAGLKQIYVADLDAISGNAIQISTLGRLVELGLEQILIDVGWRGDESDRQRVRLARFASQESSATWIGATESCRSIESLQSLIECVSAGRTWLGLDFREGTLLSHGPSEDEWIDAAIQTKCVGTVVLDVAAVGTASGPRTMATCRRLGVMAPRLKIVSGGGVRHQMDAQAMIDAGCDGILVATALYPNEDHSSRTEDASDSSALNFSLKPFD